MLRTIEAEGDYFTCGKVYGASCAESIAYRVKRELTNDSVDE